MYLTNVVSALQSEEAGAGTTSLMYLTANVSVCMGSIFQDHGMRVQIAAQQLSVGVTTLKKICRTASVNRWPFRKRTSIERLIERTEYFMPLVGDDAELQQHMAALQALLERKEDFKVSTCLHCIVPAGMYS